MLFGRTELEKKVLDVPELKEGLKWGTPRPGHSEGAVEYHVQEIWNKIDEGDYTNNEIEILRFVALVHDSFKYQVDFSQLKTGENHHGYRARQFAQKYVLYFTNHAEEILEMIQWHDEPYNIYSKLRRDGFVTKERTVERIGNLLNCPIKNWQLFVDFIEIDGGTGGKINDTSPWFISVLSQRGKL